MRSRRNTELALLLAGFPVLVLLFGMYLLNQTTDITVSSFIVPIGLFAAFVIAHLVIRRFAPNADPAILPITFVLSGIGIVFVMRLAPDLAMKQLLWLYIGIAAMIVTLMVVRNYERLAHYKYTILLVGIILLLLPALIGTEKYGSKIWITFGGFSFQPGELAKILIVIFLASYLAENREMLSVSTHHFLGLRFPDLRTLAPLLVMWLISIAIVAFERDLGSALLFFVIFVIMLYVCTGRWFYVLSSLLLLAIGAVICYKMFGHVRTRVAIWLDPFSDAQGDGYQLVQALYSMADGGLCGSGIGRGLATKIPVVESDFIFAAIAEEMGLLGAAGVLILYMVFAVRGFLVASRAKSDVASFSAVGFTAAISFQAFVIVGGVTRLIPLTGLTLPFMSQGGSSLLASFIIVGLLLRISDEATGLETEMTGAKSLEGGVLGRFALGKRLTATTVLFTVLFAVLIGNLTYIQVVKASEYQNMPDNNHTLEKAQRNQRGAIVTSDGLVLAQSVLSDDGTTFSRVYPQGTLAAHIVGYSSVQYGQAGVEATANDYLVGQTGFSTWKGAIESLAGTSVTGDDVTLTIQSSVQTTAESQLSGKTGAVVCLDPTTGAVLASASSPTYDPNDIATALTDSSGAMFNRATQGLYAPGSSFKIVTLTAALEAGLVDATTQYPSPGSITIGNGVVTNYGSEDYGTLSVQDAIAVSSNTVFAQIADQLGSQKLVAQADAFGMDDDSLGTDINIAASLMPNPDAMTEWETAWAGVGQPVGDELANGGPHNSKGPQVTVMQMAMIGSAIANGGIVMRPYVIEKISTSDGKVVSTTQPVQYGQACSYETASEVLSILTNAVVNGNGYAAAIDGATVAGKTGTAQTGSTSDTTEDDAWFVGIATANGKTVVCAVVIEGGGTGSEAAAPVASQVMAAALKALGAL